MRTTVAICLIVLAALGVAEAQTPTVASPAVTITLGSRHAHANPTRQGFSHTGGGNTDIAQPLPDTIVITMTGVSVAGAHPCKHSSAAMSFDLDQCFEIAIAQTSIQRAKMTLEGRVIGLLRSHGKGGGSAQEGPAQAVVTCGTAVVSSLVLTPHNVTCGENLSINCRTAPVTTSVGAGSYALHQTWVVSAVHPSSIFPCKAASAEFAPDPALDPLWISYWEPFHGAIKKDFGFQVVLRVAPDNAPSTNGK
jgi:hypothetical protein